MAVDISTDLNITLLARDMATPTNNGLYGAGSPQGGYVPGKDFSPADDVSTDAAAQLNFSIAFDSVSNQRYGLDRVFIQSVDDPRTDGTGAIPGRWINQDPDPADIADNGLNAVIPGYHAQMSSIVFDEAANIQSNSTLTTGISAALPGGFWWKSKIMPKIRVVAVKDGIEKVSAPLQLPTVRLSTAGAMVSALNSGGGVNYTVFNGRKGFFVPFFMYTSKFSLPNVTPMLDEADFDLITYEVDISAAVNGRNIPLATADFFVTNAGGTVVSLTYAAGVLTLVIRQKAPGDVSACFNAFVPFDAGTADQAAVTVNAAWHTVPPVITNFVNRHLFTQSATGSASREAAVDTGGAHPVSPGRRQAITDLIESAAMEQRALARILSAEGKKPQKALFMPLTPDQTLALDRSVTSMVEAVSVLEHILKRKLNVVDGGLCGPCQSGAGGETQE